MSDQFLRDFIAKLAADVGLHPAQIMAVAKTESGPGKPGSGLPFNPNATSKKGAKGVMQLMPGTAKAHGVTDRTDPYQSLEGGAKYLSSLGGDLAAYNAGPTKAKQAAKTGRKLPKETRDYTKKVGITEMMERPKMQPEIYQEYYKYLPEAENYTAEELPIEEGLNAKLYEILWGPPKDPNTFATPYMLSPKMIEEIKSPSLGEMI